MKQFFALAGLFAVLSVSAQQQPQINYQRGSEHQKEMVANRQYQRKDVKHERPSAEQRLKKFDQYGLSASQKQKVKALYESRDREMKKDFEKRQKEMAKHRADFQKKQQDFDKKLEKILDKQQFAQYKLDREQRMHKRGKSSFKHQKPEMKQMHSKRFPA